MFVLFHPVKNSSKILENSFNYSLLNEPFNYNYPEEIYEYISNNILDISYNIFSNLKSFSYHYFYVLNSFYKDCKFKMSKENLEKKGYGKKNRFIFTKRFLST